MFIKDIREAGEKAAIQGAINATVDSVFDTFGDGVTEKLGLSGKNVVGSVLVTNVTKEATRHRKDGCQHLRKR